MNHAAPIVSELICLRRPLMPLATAAYLLARSEDGIAADVEAGRLNPAWDLRGKTAAKGCVRVLAKSLNGPVDESQAYAWLPKYDPTLTNLSRMLSLSPDHVTALVKAGLLRTTGEKPKVKESPHIDRASVLQFLETRRIGMN